MAEWMKSNFGPAIDKAVKGTPFSTDILCGIACQETAYFWLPLLKRLSAKEILARCVLDANGDYPGTKRRAFPTNTAAFRNQYGDEFADMLTSEANAEAARFWSAAVGLQRIRLVSVRFTIRENG